ncbi:MAG: ROK family protein [Bacteroidetes bacterium]|nr:ROK family protein [Bacteroidota bacterium]
MNVLGIDIGGSGIKGAPVNVKTGELLAKRKRFDTPQPATPDAVADTVLRLVRHFDWDGPLGVAFPARVRRGVAETASNIDKAFIGLDVDKLLEERTGLPTHVLNDADAAGVGEVHFGGGQGVKGVVMMITLGTGIGSGLFVDGHLVPNTELGHVVLPGGKVAEPFAADRVRKAEKLDWKTYGKRVQKVIAYYDFLFAPDLMIVGGGVSKPERWSEFGPLLKASCPIVPATLKNDAGIIGAAYHSSTLK